MPEADDLTLAADFPAASRDDWRKLVDGVLKGAPFDRLVGRTYDGLTLAPITTRAQNAHVIAGRAAATPWRIVQRVDQPDARAANTQALHDLENGATGLALVFSGAAAARGFGLPPAREALAQVLDGVYLDAGIALDLDAGDDAAEAARLFAALVNERALDPAAVDIRFGLDPVGAAAARGGSEAAWPELAKDLAGAVKELAAAGFKGPFAAADGRVIHDAGGAEAQELAFVLATLVAYLRALEQGGLPLETARAALYARLAADADQFLTLAKFRTLRLLWARIEAACGLTPAPLVIAADTAWRMLTQRDPYVNLLRATVATFAAGLGGANGITVLPHTLALGLPDAFARRLARNTQLILLEESNLARVSDPAAGSGGIEDLTRQLCTAAWAKFQEIETAGGVFAALAQNLIQREVTQTRAARDSSIARRRDVLTGASEFPNLREDGAAVLAPAPAAAPARAAAAIAFETLAATRLAAPFERLRDASDALLNKTGARPKVFLANLGTPADFTARATFAKSFFEAGGIEAVDFIPPLPAGERSAPQVPGEGANSGGGNPSPAPSPSAQGRPLPKGEVEKDFAALADASKASGASLACLCSSDAVYAAQAVEAAQALHAAGIRHIYLAGRPGEHEAAFRAAGIGTFVFAGADALATLTAAYGAIGAAVDRDGTSRP